MEVILFSVVLVAIAFLLLGINIFFRKGKKFPETEVGKNREMRKLGIYCVKCEEKKTYREKLKKRPKKIDPSKLKLDLG